MNATCEITHGTTGGGWTPGGGGTAGTPVVTYTGPCRVQYDATAPRDTDAADQLTTEQTVLVAIPRGADAQREDARVRITAVDSNGPSSLVGRLFVVRSVNRSSLGWEQDLTCVDDTDNQPGV